MADRLTEKLSKLIPMLSSDRDGEVLASVAAIGRALESSGRDWHWLAAQLLTPAPQRPEATAVAWWQACSAEVQNRAGSILSQSERSFLFNVGKMRTPPTEAQQRWLSALAKACGVKMAEAA